MAKEEKALVLLSGGQDSATCLAWALERFDRVETVGFDYGQRHAVELECRAPIRDGLAAHNKAWAGKLGEDIVLPVPTFGAIGETAMTAEIAIEFDESGLPTTFVPGRNLAFMTFAAALASRRGARHLVTGVCETDYSGYPDCRDDTMKALQVTLNLGLAARLVLHTPLMWRDKAESWQLAEELGGDRLVEMLRRETHSCYMGVRRELHAWGFGCADCPACALRAAGWAAYCESRT
jgi:7-cyano-7-deazaguanine synthase